VKLEGSCHCGAVKFSVESKTPYPFSRCYCVICRKTSGGGGYTINIMGEADTMVVDGEENVTVYRAAQNDREAYDADGLGFSRRHFCSKCGSALWVHSPNWPDLIHPFASAIDTPLPKPPEVQAIMTAHAVPWADLPDGPHFEHYPDQGIEDWHKTRGLYGD
jgi:hypothetical protein